MHAFDAAEPRAGAAAECARHIGTPMRFRQPCRLFSAAEFHFAVRHYLASRRFTPPPADTPTRRMPLAQYMIRRQRRAAREPRRWRFHAAAALTLPPIRVALPMPRSAAAFSRHCAAPFMRRSTPRRAPPQPSRRRRRRCHAAAIDI